MTIHATFAGRQLIRTASFTLSQGTTPGTGTITAPGWDAFPSTGYLHLSDGDTGFRIGPLYVVESRNIESREGKICVAVVADSRVLWKYGGVCGVYNRPDKSGHTEEKTFRQLIIQILDEPGHRHSIIWPRRAYQTYKTLMPPVSWEAVTPATALQELCDRYGLSVGFDIANQVYIAPINITRDWPDSPPIRRGGAYSQGPFPSHMVIVGDRIIDEIWFRNLVPVGMELDGTIKHINNLSYKPTQSWGLAAVHDFVNIEDKYRAVAKKCIYKWYQWREARAKWPGYNVGTLRPLTVAQRQMYLPWLDEISSYVVDEDGVVEHGRPYVYLTNSYYYDGTVWVPTNQEIPNSGVTIDGQRGLVMFDRITAVYLPSSRPDAQEFQPAEVSVRASFELNSNNLTDFYQYSEAVGWRHIPEKFHREPGLRRYRIDGVDQTTARWTAGGLKYKGDLDSYADEIIEVYRTGVFADRRGSKGGVWPGLLHYACYGEMRTIRWSVGAEGATTEISGGAEELSLQLPPYQERALMQKVKHSVRWDMGNLPVAPPAGKTY